MSENIIFTTVNVESKKLIYFTNIQARRNFWNLIKKTVAPLRALFIDGTPLI